MKKTILSLVLVTAGVTFASAQTTKTAKKVATKQAVEKTTVKSEEAAKVEAKVEATNQNKAKVQRVQSSLQTASHVEAAQKLENAQVEPMKAEVSVEAK